jgi:hypothetical protein
MWKLSLIFSCLCFLLLAQPVLTRTPDTIPCPVPTIHYPADAEARKPFVLLVELNCSEEIVLRGRKIKIYDKKSLTYNWKLSAGEILEGQGTAQIRIDATGVNAEEITATVEVSGFAPECANKATRSIKFGPESNASEKPDKP